MRQGRTLPKLKDVADRAGVSTATVSRFLNNPGLLSGPTAERVHKAVEETGYLPNRLAGGLASNRSRLVAVFVPDIAHSMFNATVEAMMAEFALDGNLAMLGLTRLDDSRMPDLVQAALAMRVDAIVLTGVLGDPDSRAMLRESSTTVIETWGLAPDPIDVAVGFSHYEVGVEIARFALERGYRRPHLLSARGTRASERRSGFITTWQAAGGAEPTEMMFDPPTRFGHARAAFRALREQSPRPDLVICSSDWLAQGVLVEAMAAGLRVPDDIAVIGFGNLPLAADMRPTMTTIDIDGARIGREAVDVLRRRAASDPIERPIIDVGFQLVGRESA